MLVNQGKDVKGSDQAAIQQEKTDSTLRNAVMVPHPDVQCSLLDGEGILLNLETGAYFTLNRVGTVTWELFNGERTLTQVHSAICERFEVNEDVAQRDLLSLVKQLDQEGLIQSERR